MIEARLDCPNVIPGNECVDPDCAYCKIAREESPKAAEEKEPA